MLLARLMPLNLCTHLLGASLPLSTRSSQGLWFWVRAAADRQGKSSPSPSSLIPHPSSLIPHPSSLIPHPSSLSLPFSSPLPPFFRSLSVSLALSLSLSLSFSLFSLSASLALPPSVTLSHLQALANMQRGMFSEAVEEMRLWERNAGICRRAGCECAQQPAEDLQRALAASPNDPDVLAHGASLLISCSSLVARRSETPVLARSTCAAA